MVKVRIYKDDYGYQEIDVRDHADSSVCMAISTLMWALSDTLMNISPKPDITKMVLESGHLSIRCNPLMDEQEQAIIDAVFFTVHIGLMQLEKKYPQEISFSTFFDN
ncbi:MAG: ribosomal-processing cysteine protease Prp [Acidaminobacter sp.]|uniref:ribosomal-processing cysteine protease Prp n=1 Tax=Acidaminobacter sp. TaxID=1872102 RepID=UPI0013820ADC|nr:ribosomal-processing cysteine protease Prp [Acidaminobacter sp.]MZQ97208.1 ribosomal-processing cysteine protease Prp [Acidaminobacter sp.]